MHAGPGKPLGHTSRGFHRAFVDTVTFARVRQLRCCLTSCLILIVPYFYPGFRHVHSLVTGALFIPFKEPNRRLVTIGKKMEKKIETFRRRLTATAVAGPTRHGSSRPRRPTSGEFS
jgi:hypothetical protein